MFILNEVRIARVFVHALVVFILFPSTSCAPFFRREVRLHTWSQYTIDNYKIVHAEFTHGFPRRYDAYRLYKIKKNGIEKMLSTTDFKYLDTTQCTLYFEIKDRRKIYFDVCTMKRLKKGIR